MFSSGKEACEIRESFSVRNTLKIPTTGRIWRREQNTICVHRLHLAVRIRGTSFTYPNLSDVSELLASKGGAAGTISAESFCRLRTLPCFRWETRAIWRHIEEGTAWARDGDRIGLNVRWMSDSTFESGGLSYLLLLQLRIGFIKLIGLHFP